jgi:hypothetical protein
MSSDEFLVGPVVRPTNRHYASGIHDDSTAQAAGFRGGTIAGSAHLDTLVPLALDLCGQQWFETGSVSFTFKYPTTDGEPTLAMIERTDTGGQHAARVETPDGVLVGFGTVGAPGASAVTQLHSSALRHDRSNARILQSVEAGDPIGPGIDTIDGDNLLGRVEHGLITEPIEWYRKPSPESPWGAQIVPPSAVIDSVNRVVSAHFATLPPAVGMWSALEVRFVNGPVLADVPYRITGEVAAIDDSPKTEIIWQDCTLSRADRDPGDVVASVRIQSRFVKSTSALWSDQG